MAATTALAKTADHESDKPSAEELGRLFLKPDGKSRFVVSSPGDISAKCEMPGRQPTAQPKVANER